MKHLTIFLSLMFFITSIDQTLAAGRLLSTMEVVDGQSLDLQRENLRTLISSEKVRAKMVAFGVDPDEALKRAASLSEAEVRSLSEQIEKAPAGADGAGGVIGAVLFVFIVLLITDILGFTKVFPFTRSIN